MKLSAKRALIVAGEVGTMLALRAQMALATSHTTPGCDPSAGDVTQGAKCAQPSGVPDKLFGDGSLFQNVTNILIFLVGAVAVLMLIIGGLRYVLSGGDPAGVKGAKDTILYAIIGIIVAVMAFAIVNFVLGSVIKV